MLESLKKVFGMSDEDAEKVAKGQGKTSVSVKVIHADGTEDDLGVVGDGVMFLDGDMG